MLFVRLGTYALQTTMVYLSMELIVYPISDLTRYLFSEILITKDGNGYMCCARIGPLA